MVAQVAVPAQRRRAPPGRQLLAHQLDMGRFVGGVFAHQPLQVAGLAQQPQELVAQALARRLGPGFVAGVGQEVAAVELRGRLAGLWIAAAEGLVRGALEAVGVGRHRMVGQ